MIVPCAVSGLLRREPSVPNSRPRSLRLRYLLGIGTALVCLSAGTVEGATLTIAWDPNPEPDVASYILYYGTSPNTYTASINVGNVTQYQFREPVAGQVYFFKVQAVNTSGAGGPLSAEVSSRPVTVANFDKDNRADLVVFRPSDGGWWVWPSQSTSGYRLSAWGAVGDIPLAGDFDGDRQSDLAVYRPSTGYWFILYSASGYSPTAARSFQWGANGDVPLLADFDGDRRADLTVYRPSTGEWHVWYSSKRVRRRGRTRTEYGFVTGNWRSFQWGAAGDQPLSGDFDGDGKTDLAVFRPMTGEWWVAFSSNSYSPSLVRAWGADGDQPVAGDFDGDGKTDLTVFRPTTGAWFVWYSSSGFTSGGWGSFEWGRGDDRPAVNDYDGDGRTDIAVWRPAAGEWYILYSSTNFQNAFGYQWGAGGDIPIAR